jgi:Ca-activated chloride channel family protein
MFRFEHPEFIWLAGVALVILGAHLMRKKWRQQDMLKWSSSQTATRLNQIFTEKKNTFWLTAAALVMLLIAALNPQWGFRTRAIEKKTGDIYVLLDISNSMLAEDVAPSRMDKAKFFARDLARAFRDDRVGLVFFAGNAYMQSPLTTDWRAIEIFLNAAHPNQAGTQGTAIGEAILLATMNESEEKSAGHGALIVITDGEDHDNQAPAAVRGAVTKGWTTYVIGVGSEEGSTIPITLNNNKDVKRDETGQPVITKINRKLMMELAREGQGKYYDITQGAAIIDDLKSQLAMLERSHEEERSFSEHISYYQWFIMAAIIILLTMVTIRYQYDVI